MADTAKKDGSATDAAADATKKSDPFSGPKTEAETSASKEHENFQKYLSSMILKIGIGIVALIVVIMLGYSIFGGSLGELLPWLIVAAIIFALGFIPSKKQPWRPTTLKVAALAIAVIAIATSAFFRPVVEGFVRAETCIEQPSQPECRQPTQTNCPEEKVIVYPGQSRTYVRREDCQNMFWSRQNVDTVIEAVFQGDDGECTYLWDASGVHPSYNGTVSTVTLTNKGDKPTSIWFAYR